MTTNPWAMTAPGVIDLFPDENEKRELQTRFAVALLRNPDDAFKAALEVFGAETGKALYAAQNWIHDDFVEKARAQLVKTHGARAFLPTKEDYAREVWKLAMHERTPTDDKKYLLSLYGDIMGYKQMAEKPGISITNVQGVMVVQDHGTDAEWEQKAMAQQASLTSGAKAQAIDVPSRTVQ